MSLEDEITGRTFRFSQIGGSVLGTITLLPKGDLGFVAILTAATDPCRA